MPLILLIAVCAAGAGVTGTLLLTRNAGASAPAYVPIVPESSASAPSSAPAATDAHDHEPPPSLTQGQGPVQAELTLANWHYDNQHWEESASHYKNAIAAGLDNADVRTDYGNALRFSGEPKEALKQYQIAQTQNPDHEQSLFNQGGLWAFSLKDKAKGIAAWKTYLKKFPQGQSAADARRLMAQVQSGAKAKPKQS